MEPQIKVIIADDEPHARENMGILLSVYPEIKIVGESNSFESTCAIVSKTEPDALFLDIQMPGGDGFDVVNKLNEYDFLPIIVFVTAFDHYALRAFEINALDYLLKPINRDRISQTLERIKQNFTTLSKSDNLCFTSADLSPFSQKKIQVTERSLEKIDILNVSLNDKVLLNQSSKQFFINVKDISLIKAQGNNTNMVIFGKKNNFQSKKI
ncbi:putative transcriptional regulatory protein YehT [Desulfamplus magnetovallimortis]|uniref:Putative transcriptional regulatory protein YehT n=1 Tax=Desulfamplus magnetovallimortis TaxID=1246637 RepID=A0A1W1HCS6_9BACT|nr:response regulator [Desulfamplus magnetovallimortis]SLM30212.1 putative transcriptional regulatory protein YehT [Desulfamplus magnetovallimortis]